jgi:ABC-2 type transport system ATP-binding protein
VAIIVFSTDQLYKSFGDKQVLKGISITARSGGAMGLLGRNGAGKTTAIRIIMGVFPPDSGSVLMDGAHIDRERLNIGYLPEERGLYPKSLISEQLVYFARLRGMSANDAKKNVKYWLERMDMDEYADKKLDVLSKGNQQKIQLAVALIAAPEFIILDEPFSGLDPVNASMLKDVVKEQIREGRIVLFSSHQMNYVEEFCDHIAILHHGKIVLDGATDDIKRSYDRRKLMVRSRYANVVEEYVQNNLGGMIRGLEQEEGGVIVTLDEENRKNRFIAALASQDIDIDGIYVYEPSLNDIFVEYTGDEAEVADEAV